MPELPEVETVMRGMAKAINGKEIAGVDVFSKRLRLPIPPSLKKLSGEKIGKLYRRAKYILVPFETGRVLILHLGMTGRVIIKDSGQSADTREKHDHFAFRFSDGTHIVYNDARRFGLVDISDAASLSTHRFFAHLGPEPFSDAFKADYLCARLQDRRSALKVMLMDQETVVGVGNIYAAEALHRARIDPHMPAGDLTLPQARSLIKQIRIVLQQSIDAGGSSLRDYVQTDGELGYYQDEWRVYGRAGETCLRRGCGGTIARSVQGGRSTFYCPDCQV